MFDAISVHPYRQSAPESAIEEYRALRLLIRRHCAADALPLGTYDPSRPEPKRHIPILSGEWGYSTAWNQPCPLYLATSLVEDTESTRLQHPRNEIRQS